MRYTNLWVVSCPACGGAIASTKDGEPYTCPRCRGELVIPFCAACHRPADEHQPTCPTLKRKDES